MLNLLRRQEENTTPRDVLVVLSDDGTADIGNVIDFDEQRLLASTHQGEYAVPAADIRSFTGRHGRIYVYGATWENISDCKRIADLERSTVLKQITHFEKEGRPVKLPIGKIMLFGGIILFVIILLMTLGGKK